MVFNGGKGNVVLIKLMTREMIERENVLVNCEPEQAVMKLLGYVIGGRRTSISLPVGKVLYRTTCVNDYNIVLDSRGTL